MSGFSLEKQLVCLMQDDEKFEATVKFIDKRALSECCSRVLETLESYFEHNEEVDWDSVYLNYTMFWSKDTAVMKAAVKDFIDEVKTMDPTKVDSNVSVLLAMRSRASDMSDICSIVFEDGMWDDAIWKKLQDHFEDWRDEYDRVTNTGKTNAVSVSNISDVLKELERDSTIDWPVEKLQGTCGPLSRGDFVILGARPDGGKTSFLSHIAVYNAHKDRGKTVLWCNNEEPIKRVRVRQCEALLEWPYEKVMEDLEATQSRWDELIADRIVMLDKADMTIFDIERMCRRYNPDLLILDKLMSVQGFESTANNEVVRMQRIAARLRELAKQYCPIIGTIWLDPSADNTEYPPMSSLYGSKTSLQGEADAIVLLGRLDDEPDYRYVSVPKNKLPFADPKKRHLKHRLRFRSDIARFKDF